jgi:hypothetical protein
MRGFLSHISKDIYFIYVMFGCIYVVNCCGFITHYKKPYNYIRLWNEGIKGMGELDSGLKGGAVWQNRHGGAKSGVEQKNKKIKKSS